LQWYGLLLGHTPFIRNAPPAVRHLEWRKKYGPVLHYQWMFGADRVLVSDPELIRHVLVTNKDNYNKQNTGTNILRLIIGDGLVTLDFNEHKKHRKLINPIFSTSNLNQLVSVFADKTANLLNKWDAENPTRLDVSGELNRLTLDIIGTTAFHYEFNAITNGENDPIWQNFISINKSLRNPFNLIPGFLTLNFMPSNALRNRALNKIADELKSIINKRREEIAKSGIEKPKDFNLLDLLLTTVDEVGGKLTDDEIINEVKTFLFAGHDTTSTAVAWTLYCLAQNLDVETNIHKELETVLAGGKPTAANLDKLRYLGNVIKETLRVYPPVPIIPRNTAKDDTLPSGHFIPAGTQVMISPYVMHMDPELWENPEKFDPTRFDNETINPLAYLPFNYGDRNCIGQKFALMEAKVILAMLLQRYSFRLIPDVKIERKQVIVMKPFPKLEMKLIKR